MSDRYEAGHPLMDDDEEQDRCPLERDSARDQFDRHVEWAESQCAALQEELRIAHENWERAIARATDAEAQCAVLRAAIRTTFIEGFHAGGFMAGTLSAEEAWSESASRRAALAQSGAEET